MLTINAIGEEMKNNLPQREAVSLTSDEARVVSSTSYEDLVARAHAELLADIPEFNVQKFVTKILDKDYEEIETVFFGAPIADFIPVGHMDDRVPPSGSPFLKQANRLSQSLKKFRGIYSVK
jgi:hypothetical protein